MEETRARIEAAIHRVVGRTPHHLDVMEARFFHDGTHEGTALGQLCDALVDELLKECSLPPQQPGERGPDDETR